MDLHDFSDVAENYDRYLEAMYSDFDAHEGDKEDLNDPMSAEKYRSNLIWILRKRG